MLQCGMPIPVRENSRTGVFDGIFIDIGDEQSISNELSTYSSHLLNMKMMMKNASPRSLLLIDEFGGGTEPQIGGALAEAILKRFIASGTYGVITTHYQNLKRYADGHSGVVNGAMLYDREKMEALFQLQIGQPGSSFAVEIARKIGIPQSVIDDATQIVGKDYVDSDKYLLDIVRDKRYWENKRNKVHQQEKRLEEIIARYERDVQELQASRKEVMAKAKEDARQLLDASNAKIENTIRSIREMQAEREKTREVRQELENFKKEVDETDARKSEDAIQRKMDQIQRRKMRRDERRQRAAEHKDKVLPQPAAKPVFAGTPRVGDYVRIKGQTSVGRLSQLNGKRAVVLFGAMQVTVDASRLVKAEAPEKKVLQDAVYMSRSTRQAVDERKNNFKPDIDVRGMRGDEALREVMAFVDDAQLLGVSHIRILHGTGTGALREIIRQYLRTVPGGVTFRDEHVQFGGSGITVVDFK
jgi:DNA mismatch repair protein MutS2